MVSCVQHSVSTSVYSTTCYPPKLYCPFITILLIPFTHFSLPLAPPPLVTPAQFSVGLVWFVHLFGVLVFYVPHMSEIIRYLCFSTGLISLSLITSRSIHVVTNGRISSFFYGWIVFHCIYTPHLHYPFIGGHLGCFHILAIGRIILREEGGNEIGRASCRERV